MSRKEPHFHSLNSRPVQVPGGRPLKPELKTKADSNSDLASDLGSDANLELSPQELQKKAAEEYARRGVERVYQQQIKQRRATEQSGIKLSKEQLEQYHQSWQDYWQKYYHQYYSDYYNQYFGKVKEDVDDFREKSKSKLNELAQDNKILVQQKQRLEDPEAIRRDLLNRIVERGKGSGFWGKFRRHVRALFAALVAASIVLFIQFNPVVVGAIKQYLGPASSADLPSIIEPSSTGSINQNPTLIIPKIGLKVPVVMDEPSAENGPVQKALERGVVRYWDTASPGETGNVAILGHSSNNLLNPGNYKYAFVNLRRLDVEDVVYIDYQNVRYGYKVTGKQVVPPTELGYIQPTEKPSVTLITCDPPGTDNNRLYVRAEQILPDPTTNKVVHRQNQNVQQIENVPASAPSFWGNL
jgi:sortase A